MPKWMDGNWRAALKRMHRHRDGVHYVHCADCSADLAMHDARMPYPHYARSHAYGAWVMRTYGWYTWRGRLYFCEACDRALIKEGTLRAKRWYRTRWGGTRRWRG